MVWYSRGSSMSLYRLLLITYLASHVVRYVFENPPIISRSVLKDLGELINEGLIELRTSNGRSIIRVTDRGRRLIGELYGLSNEYVLFGDYLIVRLRDLFNELARLVNAYQDMDTTVLLSIALREASLREGGGVEGNVLRDLAFDLRRPCENALG